LYDKLSDSSGFIKEKNMNDNFHHLSRIRPVITLIDQNEYWVVPACLQKRILATLSIYTQQDSFFSEKIKEKLLPWSVNQLDSETSSHFLLNHFDELHLLFAYSSTSIMILALKLLYDAHPQIFLKFLKFVMAQDNDDILKERFNILAHTRIFDTFFNQNKFYQHIKDLMSGMNLYDLNPLVPIELRLCKITEEEIHRFLKWIGTLDNETHYGSARDLWEYWKKSLEIVQDNQILSHYPQTPFLFVDTQSTAESIEHTLKDLNNDFIKMLERQDNQERDNHHYERSLACLEQFIADNEHDIVLQGIVPESSLKYFTVQEILPSIQKYIANIFTLNTDNETWKEQWLHIHEADNEELKELKLALQHPEYFRHFLVSYEQTLVFCTLYMVHKNQPERIYPILHQFMIASHQDDFHIRKMKIACLRTFHLDNHQELKSLCLFWQMQEKDFGFINDNVLFWHNLPEYYGINESEIDISMILQRINEIDHSIQLTNHSDSVIDSDSEEVRYNKISEEWQHVSDLVKHSSSKNYRWFDMEQAKQCNIDDFSEEVRGKAKRMLESIEPEKKLLTLDNFSVFDDLYEKTPNFTEVISFYKGNFILNQSKNNPQSYCVPNPVLLVGESGIGKTYFAKLLANLLATNHYFIDANSITANWVLAGSSPSWRDASCGLIFKYLNQSNTVSPIIIFDEIDKLSYHKNYDPLSTFLQLLEPENARIFNDEFFNFTFDASKIIYILSANSIHDINDTLLSRMTIFNIEKPDRAQSALIAQKIYTDILGESVLFNPLLNEEQIEQLANYSPRQIKQILMDSLFSQAATLNGTVNNEFKLKPLHKKSRPGFH
jgi:ATP-dependent Lon protease